MSKEQKDTLIRSWIQTLAMSQGMYGRLLRAIDEADDDARESFFAQYRDCNDMLDFVMAYEC